MTETTGRIVVGYDGSAGGKAALSWAARQAELTGATLEIVTAWHWPTSVGLVPFGDYLPSEDAETLAKEGAASVDLPIRQLKTRVLEGLAAQRIAEAAKGADLLVVGSRGHNDFTDLLLGSVSSYCVHHAPCAVVIVRPTR